KTRHRLKQRVKVAKQIPHQAVGHVALKMRVTVQQFTKAEIEVVEGIYQFPHALDASTHQRSVLAELGGGNVAGREGGVDRIGGELAATQRQEDPGGEHGVEEGEGIPDQD